MPGMTQSLAASRVLRLGFRNPNPIAGDNGRSSIHGFVKARARSVSALRDGLYGPFQDDREKLWTTDSHRGESRHSQGLGRRKNRHHHLPGRGEQKEWFEFIQEVIIRAQLLNAPGSPVCNFPTISLTYTDVPGGDPCTVNSTTTFGPWPDGQLLG